MERSSEITLQTYSGGRIGRRVKDCKGSGSGTRRQILGYLKSARLEHGLLINFGSPKFEMRKFVWTERK
jgi:hypothetical protein